MAKDKIDLHRAFYPLEEAAELAQLKVEDLLHMAANGKLKVSVIADEWKAASIYEIDHSIDTAESGLPISFRGPELPEFPTEESTDFAEEFEEWQRQNNSRDVVIGNRIYYARLGTFKGYYQNPISEVKPVSASSFDRYLISPATAKIELDLNRMLGVPDAVHERFIQLDPDVLVQYVFDGAKLVVLKEDLEALLSPSAAGMGKDKPLDEREKKTLYAIIAAMHSVAKLSDEHYKVAELVVAELARLNYPFTPGTQSVALHLKEIFARTHTKSKPKSDLS